jgi:hypothetical protein
MTRTSTIAIITLIIAIAIFTLTRPVSEKRAVPVRLPAINAVEYLSDTSRLNKWMVPFLATPFQNGKMSLEQDQLEITAHAGLKLGFRRTRSGNTFDFSISVLPHRDSTNSSYLILDYSIPRWKSLTSNRSMIRDARQSLDSLKEYLGNPNKLYGFPIIPALVEDTAFLFASRMVPKDSFVTASKALFDMLIQEATRLGAGYNGVRICHFQNESGNKQSIFAGIGVTKRIETKAGDKVAYKLMPYQKNLLVIDYAGPYAGVQHAYDALNQFKLDYGYETMAIPFHKYLDDGYGFSDSQFVRTRVCLPVF